MQDQYVADINDYAKYALLRGLVGTGPDALRLGVAWYRTPSDGGKDGQKRRYLEPHLQPRYAPLDPDLYDRLRALHLASRHTLAAVEGAGVLPPGTTFHPTMADTSSPSPHERDTARQAWFAEVQRTLAACDVVFVDPDNGLGFAFQSTLKRFAKHASYEEVAALLRAGQSVIAIQFFHRRRSHREQLGEHLSWLAGHQSDLERRAFAIRWKEHGSLGFLVLPASQQHADLLRGRWTALHAGAWRPFVDDAIVVPARTKTSVQAHFVDWLRREGWLLLPPAEGQQLDLVARRGDRELRGWVEGHSTEDGLEIDGAYGSLLRQPRATPGVDYALVAPTSTVAHVLRVPREVRQWLQIRVFEVTDSGGVVEHEPRATDEAFTKPGIGGPTVRER